MTEQITPTERTLRNIARYCEGSPSHSALSTVYMLVAEALEQYITEREELLKDLDTLSKEQNNERAID